jgi:hypothetical protein
MSKSIREKCFWNLQAVDIGGIVMAFFSFRQINDREELRSVLHSFLISISRIIAEHFDEETQISLCDLFCSFNISESDFEIQLAVLFSKNPEKILVPELMEAVKNMSALRQEVLDTSAQFALSARHIIDEFFDDYLEDLEMQLASKRRKVVDEEQNYLLEEHRQERARLEEQIEKLRQERQVLHDLEIDEQKRRREEKRELEQMISQERQQEFEEEMAMRKERKIEIDEQLKNLRDSLQNEHEKQIEERKSLKRDREVSMQSRQLEQIKERDIQAKERRSKKEEELSAMQDRQRVLLEEQKRQRQERLEEKKEKERLALETQKKLRKQYLSNPSGFGINGLKFTT